MVNIFDIATDSNPNNMTELVKNPLSSVSMDSSSGLNIWMDNISNGSDLYDSIHSDKVNNKSSVSSSYKNKDKNKLKNNYFGKISDELYAEFKDELDEMNEKIKYDYAPRHKRNIMSKGTNVSINIKDIATSEKIIDEDTSLVNSVALSENPDDMRRKFSFNKSNIYYQRNTNNISFLKTAHQLELLGIKNNDFCLTLYDPMLMNVDPSDPNLSLEMQARVVMECTLNFWYFIREVVKIPESGSTIGAGKGVPYALHRGNLALNYCLLNNYNTYLVLPRQNFKTMSACIFYLWVYNLASTNSEILLFNKDMSSSKDNLRRIQELRECLPTYLQFTRVIGADGKIKKGRNSTTFMLNPKTHNKLSTKPSATSIDSANNLGRGSTAPMLWLDEFEWQAFNEYKYKAMAPAFSQAKLSASKHNKPYHKLITTTPGNLKTDRGKYSRAFNMKCAKFLDKMYDWDYETQKQYLKTFSKNDFFFIYYNYKELGRDEEWFDEQCRGLDGDPIAIRREILCEWLDIAENPLFDEDIMARIREGEQDPIRKLWINEFCELELYDIIDPTKIYIIGVDVAAGVSRDSSTTVIIDPDTCKVVGVFNSNIIDPTTLSDFLETLCSKYFRRSILAIENNHAGCAVISNLKRTSVRNNLYAEKIKDDTKDSNAQGFFQDNKGNTYQYGIVTNKARRIAMMDILNNTGKEFPHRFVSKIIINEIAGLKFDAVRDRVDHASNSHDDTVMAYLIGMNVYQNGTNIMRYGLMNYYNRFDSEGNDLALKEETKTYAQLVYEMYGITSDMADEYNEYNLDDTQYMSIEEYNKINRIKMDSELIKANTENNQLRNALKGIKVSSIEMMDVDEDPDMALIEKHSLTDEGDTSRSISDFLDSINDTYSYDSDGVLKI